MPAKSRKVEPVTGFDVTQVIGRVEFNTNGDTTPYEAAFQAIAQFGMPGDFQFPAPMGEGTIHVSVAHETPHDLNSDVMSNGDAY